MDNLTHTLTGLLLSRAGLSRVHPRAAVILTISANIPDIDVASLAWGTVDYLRYHRGITHGLAFLPAMACVAVFVGLPFLRGIPKHWRRLFALAAIGSLTHLMLDWMNMYGIRLLLPFDATWYSLSYVNVMDPWIWGVYGLAIFWPVISGLVSSEIGARRPGGRGIAIFALVFVTALIGVRAVLHNRAVALQQSRVYEGQPPRQVFAIPTALNPWKWRGIVETKAAFHVSDVNLLLDFDPTTARVYYKPERIPAQEQVFSNRTFQTLLDFSPAVYFRIIAAADPPGAVRVEAIDLRFGEGRSNRFRATALVDAGGRLIQTIP